MLQAATAVIPNGKTAAAGTAWTAVRVIALLPLLACLFGVLAVGVGLLQPASLMVLV